MRTTTTKEMLLWEERINERARSGMTIKEWCKKNEISKHKYHYWNHLINKKQKTNTNKEMVFAEVTPIISEINTDTSEPNSAKADDFQIFFKDIQVTVPTNFNKGSLAELMKVLQQL